MKIKSLLLACCLGSLPLPGIAQSPSGLDNAINNKFSPIADWWEALVLTSIPITDSINIPIVLIILIGGATFFTVYFRFVNVRRFALAINTVRGKYDKIDHVEAMPTDTVNVVEGDIVDTIRHEGQDGEVSHFQALAAAVSGTVGLGNIAGVAIAIVMGGPGATFWMILAGLLGMSSKFVECTLGVSYRDVDKTGRVYGGPMYYLSKGLKQIGFGGLGKGLAILFAILCVGGSFGGGNMFQSNQAASQIITQFGFQSGFAGTLMGVLMAILVAVVIIGGIKRIGNVAEKIVPFMAILYVLASLTIIFLNFNMIGSSLILILKEAFNPTAVAGGLVGTLVTGFRRAAFSNEAGVGSAAIAHSAVKTKFPASEGIVALLEPFIDTVVICTMTALVIIITGNHINPEGLNGVDLTTKAFESSIPGASYVLTLAIILFAFSTMLSWSYYGLQSWLFLFGRTRMVDLTYKMLFLVFIVIGAASTLDAVVKFADAMILAMVFPNMIGLMFLFPKVKKEIKRYVDAVKLSVS